MKIGPMEVSYRMIIYVALIGVGIVMVCSLWRANSEIRAESMYRNSVLKGLYDDRKEVLVEAIEAAQKVVQYSPHRVDARLYLGSLLYRQGAFSDAQKTFEEIVLMSGVTPQQKVWALVGAGSACFSVADKADKAAMSKAAADAEKFFKSALDIKIDGKPSVDALSALALLSYGKAGADAAKESLNWADQAVAAGSVPGLKMQAQLYNVRGLSLNAQGRYTEALAALSQAMLVRPDRADFADNRRLVLLQTISDPKLSDSQRLELIRKIEGSIALYGKYQVAAWNLLGQAYASMKSAAEYVKGPYAQALNAFQQVARLEPNELKGYRSRGLLLEDRIADLAKTLKSPVSGLRGETPVPTTWGNGPTQRFSPEDSAVLSDVQSVLQNAEAQWGATAEHASITADRVDAKLRQLSAQRRQFWLIRENDPAAKIKLMEKMQKLSVEIIALDEKNGLAFYVRGLVDIDRNDFTAALACMTAAKAHGMTSPELEWIVKELSFKPQVVDVHPASNRRWFGAVPLIAGSLRTISSGYKSVKMQLDGKEVQPALCGTQCLFVPDENMSLDGNHVAKITVVDKYNSTTEFPEVSFNIDKKAPTIKISPESGSTVSNKAIWTITLNDASGVDLPVTSVLFNTVKAPLSIKREILKNGKYTMGVADLDPPIKAGSLISETFRVAMGQELQPGEYSLTITCSDNNGNAASETKTYTVK